MSRRKSPDPEEYVPRTDPHTAHSEFADKKTAEVLVPLTDEQLKDHLGNSVFSRLTAEDKVAINDNPDLHKNVLNLNGWLIDEDEDLRRSLEQALFGFSSDAPVVAPRAPRAPAPQPTSVDSRSHSDINPVRSSHERRRSKKGKVVGAGAVLAAVGAAAAGGIWLASQDGDELGQPKDPGTHLAPEEHQAPNTQDVEQLREFFNQPDQNDLITDPSHFNDFGPASQAILDGDHEGMMRDWEKLFRGRDTGADILATYASALEVPGAPREPALTDMINNPDVWRDFMAKRTEFAKKLENDPQLHSQVYNIVMNDLKFGHVGNKGHFEGHDASDYINRIGVDPNDPHFKEALLDLSVRSNNDAYTEMVVTLGNGKTITILVKGGCFGQLGRANAQALPEQPPIVAPPRVVTLPPPHQIVEQPHTQAPPIYVQTPPPTSIPPIVTQPPSIPVPPPEETPPPYHKGDAEPTTPAITTDQGPGPIMDVPVQVPTQRVAPSGVPDIVTTVPGLQTGGFDNSPGVIRDPLPVQGPSSSVTAPDIVRDTEIGSR